ncbi:MAG: outer membrane beta-barrel protein [Betaproteobacteria bacterium]
MIQKLTSITSILLALAIAVPVEAAERSEGSVAGFYGGVSLRDRAADGAGVGFEAPASVWNRYSAPIADDSAPRALVFGGYRWSNEVAVEAAFSSIDKYALRPVDPATGAHGVGLNLAPGASGVGGLQTRSWNVDLFTTWTFYKTFALYGRLGYAQSEAVTSYGAPTSVTADRARLRDGVNYGVGLRYDMNSALGLRFEYGRFGRFAGEFGTSLPETDQVTFGVQFRF